MQMQWYWTTLQHPQVDTEDEGEHLPLGSALSELPSSCLSLSTFMALNSSFSEFFAL